MRDCGVVSGVPGRVTALTDWNGRRVLVTGATGFIGRRLAHRLADAGAELWVTVYPEDPPESTNVLPRLARQIPLSLQDAPVVRDAVVQVAPEILFHLAAVGVTQPTIDAVTAAKVNLLGVIHLLEALRETRVERAVLAGTCHEYGDGCGRERLDPANFYAASKVAGWAFARAYWHAHSLPTVTVRPFQVYGPTQPGSTLISSAIRAALSGEDLALTPGEQQRDFVFVDDVVDGLLATAVASRIEGDSIDLGTGIAHPILSVVKKIWELTDATGRILAGAMPYRTGETMSLVADADRTAALTRWRARVGLEEGLRRTINEFRSRA